MIYSGRIQACVLFTLCFLFNSVVMVSSPNRHHTNPVGTEWHWKMDPPEKILQDALEKHQNMIRQFRGQFLQKQTEVFSIFLMFRYYTRRQQ